MSATRLSLPPKCIFTTTTTTNTTNKATTNLPCTPTPSTTLLQPNFRVPTYLPTTIPGRRSTQSSFITTHAKKKNPWLDPFDFGDDPEFEYGGLFSEGKQDEDPRPPDNPDSPYGYLKFPYGYNVELTSLGSKIRGDVRRCCCIIAGGVYENLLFFPAIALIKDRYPGVEIDIVTNARGKQTYEMNKNVRFATVYDVEDDFPIPAEYTNMIGSLKGRYYDLILSTKYAGIGHAAFLFMTAARDRVSYIWPNVNAAGAGLFLSEIFTPEGLNLSEGGYHMYHEMVEWLGRPGRKVPRHEVKPLTVSISRKLKALVEKKYKDAGVDKGRYVVIHGIESDSEANMQSRGDTDSLLPIQTWAAIAKAVKGVKPLFVIPHEKEREEVEEVIADEIGKDAGVIFITTPGQLAALINDSLGVITTNTAAIQLANAREKPSIALFSSEEKARVFVPEAEERRCKIISSKTGKLIDIDVEAVKSAIQVFEISLAFA